jgi:hypothetical protein
VRDVGTEEWTQQGALALRETYLGYFFYTQGIFSKGGEKDKRSEICSIEPGGVASYVEQYQATQVEVLSPPKLFFLLPG